MNDDFKIGDLVTCDDSCQVAEIIAVDEDGLGCDIRFADGEECWVLKDLLHHYDIDDNNPNNDKKPIMIETSFRKELSELLSRYDAVINVDWDKEYSNPDKAPKIDLTFVIDRNPTQRVCICIEDALNKSITSETILM